MSTGDVHLEIERERADTIIALLEDQNARMVKLRDRVAANGLNCGDLFLEFKVLDEDASFGELVVDIEYNDLVLDEWERGIATEEE